MNLFYVYLKSFLYKKKVHWFEILEFNIYIRNFNNCEIITWKILINYFRKY
jgi:hypothetical protein